MKRYFIILIALIVLCAMPVMAKPMNVFENLAFNDNFVFKECSEEELNLIYGNLLIISDPSLTLIESHTKKLSSYEIKIIKMALEAMGFSDSSIQMIINDINQNGGWITASLYIDNEGNPTMIINGGKS